MVSVEDMPELFVSFDSKSLLYSFYLLFTDTNSISDDNDRFIFNIKILFVEIPLRARASFWGHGVEYIIVYWNKKLRYNFVN